MKIETELRMADDVYKNREKGVTIRYGERMFANQVTIVNVDDIGISCPATVDQVKYYMFCDIPFKVFLQDGFENFMEALWGMQKFYPELTPDSNMTVVYYHLES